MKKNSITLKDGRTLKTGDTVRITGDINHSNKVVFVSTQMEYDIFDDGKLYKIESIALKVDGRYKGEVVVKVANWWWSANNIFKVGLTKKKFEPVYFDINELVI